MGKNISRKFRLSFSFLIFAYMLSQYFNIGKIIATNNEDYSELLKIHGKSVITISNDEFIISEFDENIPTQIIGWKAVKKSFPNQKISNHQIKDNLYWTFDQSEDKKAFKRDTENFIKESINKFLNINFISYDFILDGNIKSFLQKNLNYNNKCYVYFHQNACYVFDGEKTVVLGIESIEASGKDVVSFFANFLNKLGCNIFNYENINQYVNLDNIKKIITIENFYWTRFGRFLEIQEIKNTFQIQEIERYMPFLMSLLFDPDLNEEEKRSCNRQAIRDIITSWLSNQDICLSKDFKPDKKVKIKWVNFTKYTKPAYSDKKSMTGRINCISDFNPQMLQKQGSDRKHIISRFKGGKIVVFDYVSFETKLSLYYCGNQEFINKYKNSDLHVEMTKIIYQTNTITTEQREIGKSVNHAILYGGGDKKILGLLKNVNNRDQALVDIKKFLSYILDTSDYVNGIYKELGYLINNFGTIIRPKKTYAAYHNFVQSNASEIVVDKLYEIKDKFQSKNINFIFQVYDSFVFDFHPSALGSVEEIKTKLSLYQGFHFPIETRIGNNYAECN